MTDKNYDIIVVGAGVAGGVFAAAQRAELNILVVERDLTEQERIIGELMQPDGLIALNKLGLKHLTENIDAQKVEGYKLIKKDKEFSIKYAEVDPTISGLGLRNGKFLLNIQNELSARPNITLVQGNVTDLIEENNEIVGITYTNANEEKINVNAALTVVADGHGSLFRKKLSEPHKNIESYFMGLILENLEIKNGTMGHMIVSGDSPILVYPIYENAFRILVDYPGDKPPRIGEKSKEKFRNDVLALLPEEMHLAFNNALDSQQIKVMPNHRMKAQAFRKKGAVLLGDSLNMRHPLTGGGMTATFNDILTLNAELENVNFSKPNDLEEAVLAYYSKRTKQVETINILANALYRVFRDEDLKEACFEYLQKGGQKSNGPLSILAGINKNRKFLLKHFFKVAMQHPLHFITKPKKQFRLYRNALAIINPLLKEEERPAMI